MSAAAELKQLGRYDLTGVLGKGAMGIVYEGMDPKLHRKVAIKTILKGHMDDDDAAKEYSMRFMREAQAVARLNHPHIVQVYDFGEEAAVAYIVMEFIKGKELKNFFDANERFELKEAVRIMCELLDALDFAHEGGIVHRDIKPANVMLDGQARVKLADFGVARVTDDRSAAEKTQAGTMVGTPAYMSPEQITGGNVDRRTDIFSAGIILYQFLTGEKPFTGSGAWTIAKKIIQDHPPVPSSINNTISPLFDSVVNKALSKAVETRYQTAKEFGAALKRALEGKSEEDDSDKTVVGSMADLGSIAKLTPQAAAARPEATKGATSATGSQEVELEFWRAIKDGNDPDDFELYVQQFPTGIYAALAKRKIAKLRGVAPEDTGAKAKEQEKKEAEEAAKRETEAKEKLAEEKAKLEAQLAQKEAEYQKREAEAEAKRIAETKARAEADAKREAEMAKREAEANARAATGEKARLEAIEKAKQEAQAELARKEAEYLKREADARAKAEAETKARREVEEKAKKDAELRAKSEAEARAKSMEEAQARAKKEAEERAKREAEAAKREAEAAKRETELKKKLAEAPRAKAPVVPIVIAMIVIVGLAGGGWYYYTAAERARVATLTAALEAAGKATEELNQAKKAELEAQKRASEARAAEDAARKSGDTAALKAATDARLKAEADAAAQNKLVQQREADAKSKTDAANAAKKAADDAKRAATDKGKTETKQEVAVAPKPEPKAEPKAAPKAETKAETKAEPEPKAPTKSGGRAERERLADEEAARKALAAAGKAPSKDQQTVVASAAPTAVANAPAAAAIAPGAAPAGKPGGSELDTLYQQALAMESGGKANEAIRIYRRAARAGSGKAAKRLGEIYDKGAPGISRDYAESLQWYETARQLGETVETAGKR